MILNKLRWTVLVFFDSFAQGLEAIGINLNSWDLVNISKEYFKEHLQKDNSWLKEELKSSLKYDLAVVSYMNNFIINGQEILLNRDIVEKRWGQPKIDGRILCEYVWKEYNKEIKLISWESQRTPNDNSVQTYCGFLITTKDDGSDYFTETKEGLVKENHIYIENSGNNHFRACIPKINLLQKCQK
ncbi:hypothetical protein [Spiroplasma endosymbiont of Nebria brevicollis]|uniref:hypothetical protein n=1 Tax=Spiroplasma endosymbiont of Nebria brevicollis TaxID=3066284 RepID=UPI00313DE10D